MKLVTARLFDYESVSLRAHLIIYSNGILKVVAPKSQIIIFQNATIWIGTKFLSLYRFETFFWRALMAFGNFVCKASGGVASVGSWKNILSFYTRYESSIPRQALISYFVRWAIYPWLCIFAFISKHFVLLVLLVDIQNRRRSWVRRSHLKLHDSSTNIWKTLFFLSSTISVFSGSVTWTCGLSKELTLKRHKTCVTWNIPTSVHFFK